MGGRPQNHLEPLAQQRTPRVRISTHTFPSKRDLGRRPLIRAWVPLLISKSKQMLFGRGSCKKPGFNLSPLYPALSSHGCIFYLLFYGRCTAGEEETNGAAGGEGGG